MTGETAIFKHDVNVVVAEMTQRVAMAFRTLRHSTSPWHKQAEAQRQRMRNGMHTNGLTEVMATQQEEKELHTTV
ncbi:hypothetical protein LSAT2_011493 [Lamellibrachia satsuma]|nr:hypothetical protein LSAT2_011493 [Lamellibrachia satsuma]